MEQFSALIPLIAPFLVSGIVYVANKVWRLIANWNGIAKQALVTFGTAAVLLGCYVLGVDPPAGEFTSWSQASLIGLVEGLLTSLVYKIGQKGA